MFISIYLIIIIVVVSYSIFYHCLSISVLILPFNLKERNQGSLFLRPICRLAAFIFIIGMILGRGSCTLLL